MIYDGTDSIFKWKGWNVFKWIVGAIIAGFLLFWMYDANNSDILYKLLCKFIGFQPKF